MQAVNRLTRKKRSVLPVFFMVRKKQKTDSECLNIFLNSLFNASSTLSDPSSDHSDKCIGALGSNQAHKSCSCSMEDSSFIYIYRSPSLNNTIHNLITTPKTEDQLYQFSFQNHLTVVVGAKPCDK